MRQYIGVSPKGPAILRNVHRDDTGEPLLYVDKNEAKKLRVSFADWLESGETITTATVTASGCTVAISTASPNVDLTISAATSRSDGDVVLKVTSSTGEIWQGVIHVRQTNRYGDEAYLRDYA